MGQLSAVPQLDSRLLPPLGFLDRVKNIVTFVLVRLVQILKFNVRIDKFRAQHGLDQHADALARTGLLISQSSWLLDVPRPATPALKMVGPVLPSPGRPLPAALEAVMAQAKHGVVVVSFGSIAQPIETVVINMFEAFKQSPCQFVVKRCFAASVPVPDNVYVVDWLPQNDLLAHRKTVAFVSHGGLNGVGEATYHGVPVLGVPMFGDQWDNIFRIMMQNMAVMVDPMVDNSVATWTAALDQVVHNPSFRGNASRVKAITRDTTKPSAALAADWVEYALRHDGAPHLIFANQPWYIQYHMDILLALAAMYYIGYKLVLRGLVRGLWPATPKAKVA